MAINNIIFAVSLAALLGCSSGSNGLRRDSDYYPDLSALQAANVEGRDYSREIYDRGAPVTIFAVHGGDIELGTSRLARYMADKDLNLYIFSGWLGADSRRLHITSTRFNDPDAVRLATSSVLGVAIHAQAARGRQVCVGGKNTDAARLVALRLEAAGFSARTPCTRLPGVSDKNIVNLPSASGVQLEITLGLLKRLDRGPEAAQRFTAAVRAGVFESLKKNSEAK